MEAKAGGAGRFSKTSSPSVPLSSKTRSVPGMSVPCRSTSASRTGNHKGVFPVTGLLAQRDAERLFFGVPRGFGAHAWVADPVEPLFFELIETSSGNLFEAFEKLVGICVAEAIPCKIEGLAGREVIGSDQQAQHADDFGRFDVGDPVYKFVRVIEALANDTARMPGVFYGEGSEERTSNAFDLIEPDERRIENVRHELPFDVHRVGFVEPDVEGRLHCRFTAALVVFELMNDHRMGIKQKLVKRVFADKRRIRDDCRVSGIFHASEI